MERNEILNVIQDILRDVLEDDEIVVSEELCAKENPSYTAPLLRQTKVDFSRSPIPNPSEPDTTAVSLYKDWPWWSVPEAEAVKAEMQADPRWDIWVSRMHS